MGDHLWGDCHLLTFMGPREALGPFLRVIRFKSRHPPHEWQVEI